MDAEQLRGEVRRFIEDNFLYDGADTLRDDVSLLDSGMIDSTGVLELITHLEGTYSVTFDDDELVAANFDSVDRVVRFLGAKLG